MAFALTGTLPNVIGGEAYAGALALEGAFTAPVTIDASVGSIPSWMSTVVSGSAVSFSGTAPASAENDSFTVRATDSSGTPQIATSAQSVSVVELGTWTARSAPTNKIWSSVAQGAGVWVATNATDATKYAYSTDGLSWTVKSFPVQMFNVAYGGGLFLTTGATSGSHTAARSCTSTDGVSWSQHTMRVLDRTWNQAVYGRGLFVAMTDRNTASPYDTAVTASATGASWETATLPDSASNYNWTLTYGDGVFVAIAGSSGVPATSTDGLTWTVGSAMPSSGTWYAAYGNGLFVAVKRSSNTAATSADGLTWTSHTLPASDAWRAIAFAKGVFVVTADSSAAALASCDGVNWAQLTMPSSQPWDVLGHGDGVFVALTANESGVAASLTVTGPSTPMTLVGALPSVIAGATYSATLNLEGDFTAPVTIDASTGAIPTWMSASVAGDTVTFSGTAPENEEADSFTVRATDSSTTPQVASTPQTLAVVNLGPWTARTLTYDEAWSGVAYGNGAFLAIASINAVSQNPYFAHSSDGLTWGWANPPEQSQFMAVVFGAGKFVTVIKNSTAVYAAPAEDTYNPTWAAGTMPSASFWFALAYGGGTFVAVATNNSAAAATSSDGVTWTESTLPVAGNWYALAYGNGLFVAVGFGGLVATSPDGVTWTQRTLPHTWTLDTIAYGNELFVAPVSGNLVVTSPDGITWTERTLPTTAAWAAIAYSQGVFVLLAGSGTASLVSRDGMMWAPLALPSSQSWHEVVWGAGVFVAITADSTTTATLPVAALPVPMTLTGTLPDTIADATYSGTLTLAGDFVTPVTIDAASGTIPSWMSVSVSGTTVTFSGTAPAAAETDVFTPRATDANSQQASAAEQTVVVTLAPMTLTGSLPNAVAGAAYSATLTLGGSFVGPVTIDASVGTIPAWMSPSVSGSTVSFSGTAPSKAETDAFTLRATDANARSVTKVQIVRVASTTPCFWDAPVRNAVSDCAPRPARFNFKTANLYDADDSSHQSSTVVSSQDQNVADAAGDLGRIEVPFGPGLLWGGDPAYNTGSSPDIAFTFPCRVDGGDFTDPSSGITYSRPATDYAVAVQLLWNTAKLPHAVTFGWGYNQNQAIVPVLEIMDCHGTSLGTWLCTLIQGVTETDQGDWEGFEYVFDYAQPASGVAGAGVQFSTLRFLFRLNEVRTGSCGTGPSIGSLPDQDDLTARFTLKQNAFNCWAATVGDENAYGATITRAVVKACAALYTAPRNVGWE